MNHASLARFAPLTLLAVAGVFAAGCGSTVENGEGAGGDDTSSSDAGSGGDTAASTSSGQTCDDPVIECPPGIGRACVDGEWECTYGTTIGSSSSGDVETCPETMPPPDTACTVEGMRCEVPSDVDCGPLTIEISCVDGVWVAVTPRCSLPPCRDIADADECGAIGCRWLEPGCGDAPLAEAGCFEAAPCSPDSCIFSDEICVTVSVEPACANEDPACGACGEEIDLCVPQLLGEDDGD